MEILLNAVNAQRSQRVKLRTLLHGWINSFQIANRTGIQNSAVRELLAAELPMVEQYCDAIYGTGEAEEKAMLHGGASSV